MIVVTSALRTSRRARRVPSLGSIIRALGSVKVSDQPPARPPHSARFVYSRSLAP